MRPKETILGTDHPPREISHDDPAATTPDWDPRLTLD